MSVGRDSSVGIANGYGLEGQEIESWWWRDFPHPSRPAVGPTHPLPSSAEVKERLELFLYSPFGPSWPFLGRIYLLPLLYMSSARHCPKVCKCTLAWLNIPPLLPCLFMWQVAKPVNNVQDLETDACFMLLKGVLQAEIPIFYASLLDCRKAELH